MDRLGKYEIDHEIGRGATSVVFLGRDPFANREVAIKVGYPDILKDAERGKVYSHLFINEASLVGKLQHPHIVQIYDAVVGEGVAYIVMEYVPGTTLEAFCKPDTLLSFERIVEIIFKCTRALNFACQIGITHRDIKPANILIAQSENGFGDIKISDFGAAITTTTDRTMVSGIGSPAYMSPQQVREESLDLRTDIYSLGVVMYQLLTGQLPFQASSNYNMVYQIIHTDPTPPQQLREELPQGIADIVARAMAKRIESRYQTWEEFAQDLAQAFRARSNEKSRFADSEKFSTLRALPFFERFSDVEIWEAVRFSQWEHVRPGHSIMHDGEDGDFFCFLAEGEVKVAKNGKTLNVLSAGDCFGEMAVIGQASHVRGADVVALGDAKVIRIPGEALHAASESCRLQFYQSFLEVLANRLTLANTRLAAF